MSWFKDEHGLQKSHFDPFKKFHVLQDEFLVAENIIRTTIVPKTNNLIFQITRTKNSIPSICYLSPLITLNYILKWSQNSIPTKK